MSSFAQAGHCFTNTEKYLFNVCFFLLECLQPQANLLEKVEGELLAINDLISKSPNFAAFLTNPTISRQEKANKVGDSNHALPNN